MKDTIIKRDGTREAYNEAKILNAVLRAAYDSTGVNNGPDLAIEVTNDVRNEMEQNPDKEYNVEEIQDLVEKHLMLSGKTDVAKQYILYRDKRTKAREKGWDLDEVGKKSYEEKYRHAGENFDEFIDRISNGNKKIAKLLREKKFVFGGRILSNRGLQDEGYKITYSNCYVLKGPEDNLESIFDVNRDMAVTFSRGGGVGFDLSRLRPKDEPVHNNARTTSGPCSFMDIYNKTTQTIGQKGRRGALMLAMRVSHPDIQEFIDLKRQLGEIECANLSVMIDDKFMEAVIGGKSYLCKFKYDDGREVLKMVNANELFTRMCENSCDYAEPGLLFWDTIDRGGLLAKDPEFSYECVNPCAEEILPAGGSCLLGHMNLSEFVVHPFTEGAYFDYDKYEEAVKQAVIALNEVLDEGESLHPLDYQIEAVRKYRQIGLGYLGIADMLIKLGIKYGSIESLQICDRIGFKTADMAIRTSAEIAKDKGTYETYNKEYVFASPFFKSNTTALTREMVRKYGLRNSQLLTCAPTGTVSLLYRTSGGIEPIFALKTERKTLSLNNGEEVKYEVNAKIVQDFMDIYGEMDIEDLPDYFVTAADIDYKDRVRFQAIWQKHIDASISSTVNLPHETSIEDIKQLFIFAWESGLKGITVYRAGCEREGILVNKDGKKDESNICPECGEELQHVEGCVTCMNCGYSKCS